MLGAVLLLAAATLAIYNFSEDWQAKLNSDEILCKLSLANIGENSVGEENTPVYITNPDVQMPSTEIDGFSYIGRIDLPSLNISLPVMSEWSYPGLKISPCRYSGSAYQNNLVILAHNYKSHFGNLKRMDYGDIVVLTDTDGNIFQYIVTGIEQLQPTDTDKTTAENCALTLITCTIDGEHRIAVRCAVN